MKKFLFAFLLLGIFFLNIAASCEPQNNKTAGKEQALTEKNQSNLLSVQPPPQISWSLERDNLIKRFKLQNDRSVVFYMYLFIEGISDPIGYYQVNKVSSVNSQLTNPQQLIQGDYGGNVYGDFVVESPAEDGSYGSNGDGVFGFTPEDIYIEHNLKYVVSSVPLNFTKPVNRLNIISVKDKAQLESLMSKLK